MKGLTAALGALGVAFSVLAGSLQPALGGSSAEDGGCDHIAVLSDDDATGLRVIDVMDLDGAVVATIPLQIFAYHVATLKGTDVDQPRNLAKSVTVE